MAPKDDYKCPRCAYTTHHKGHMRNHLYQKLKPCAATKEVIELTDEIKEHILANKIYKIPKPPKQPKIVINQYNNQQINNFISKMDPFDKLDAYIEKTQIKMLPLETQIETEYEAEIGKCETIETRLQDFSLNTANIMEIVNKLTTSKHVDTLNVVYDKAPNKLSIYDGEWETYVFEHGVKELLEKIQLNYLDEYETLLLDKMAEDPNYIERQRAKELLQEYYTFLVSFEVKPYLTRRTNDKMIAYCEQFYTFYDNTRNNVRLTQAKDIKRSVYNMVKSNCNASITELNKKMMDIICTDETFKAKVLEILHL